MIINLLLAVILAFFQAIFVFLPTVTIAGIPYIGSGLSSLLGTMAANFNAFSETIPYAIYPWHAFLFVLMSFEITMLVGKIFLGNRMPGHHS